jgi:hypothetical protein
MSVPIRRWLAGLLMLGVAHAAALAAEPPAGLRVFYTGHSFHMFVPPRVDQLAKSAGIAGHRTVGTQGIGGSMVMQHWVLEDGKNKAKPALESGNLDVFTMSCHLALPDAGIDEFVALGLKHNPKLRLLVQASWMPYDLTSLTQRLRDNAERDQTDLAALQTATDVWRKNLETQVDKLNQQHQTDRVEIVPVGDAVNELRRRIQAGTFPGVERPSQLFRDPIGHGLGHVQALAAYCNYATIYGRSPEGLTLNEPGVTPEQHPILQQIAWTTVSQYRDERSKIAAATAP